MIELEKLRAIIQMMVDNDLAEVALRDGEETIKLRRGLAHPGYNSVGAPASLPPVALAGPADRAGPVMCSETAPVDPDAGLVPIPSPMVGTFFAAADPNSPPFVSVGAGVHPDTVVCILEAMKVFNEIKAEVSGTIAKVLVANEEAVEYGQPLFLVRPRA